jgi:hypothetical protein
MAWSAGQKPNTCSGHDGGGLSYALSRNAADRFGVLIETRDMVGGLTEGSDVVSYRGSMR